MSVMYFKRFRMEIDLAFLPEVPDLPDSYFWVPWDRSILESHADVKFRCFRDELDATLFPCLGEPTGCRRLMWDIATRSEFLPEATWLVGRPGGFAGTVQGMIEGRSIGMIQNLGVVPEARGQGLGATLLIRALHGFREVGLEKGLLEVTAENTAALRLYRRLGFYRARTLYRAVESS